MGAMNTKTLIIILAAFIIGATGGYYGGKYDPASNNHLMPHHSAMHSEMNAMVAGLSNRVGDDFDKAFLAEMIVHHEGALEMAYMARNQSTRPELIRLSDEIIEAQKKEITLMQQWQKEWFGK